MPRSWLALFAFLILFVPGVGCTPAASPRTPLPTAVGPPSAAVPSLRVIAVETFLADIAQNVAGDRVKIEALMPPGIDPHAYEPTPGDARRVAESDLVIINGAGFEEFLDKLLENAGSRQQLVEASSGLLSRTLKPGEPHDEDNPVDPHYWLDPNLVVKYVENIRDGLTQADPAGAAVYRTNAEAYIAKLYALDAKIRQQVSVIPPADRKLVTDHDTFGYFADRYGFEIVGMLVPSYSTADASTAQQLAKLVDQIRATRVKAIFLEQSANPQIAAQIARETGVQIVTGLYTHSLSEPGGPAPTYLEMLEYDVRKIVDALQ